ncbi:MAG: sugar ABC transporter permease [Treponema sp.]|jgi:multiple sugar transport system permease protein|nr:sugar ABC transporter permease [Treponema sp.]
MAKPVVLLKKKSRLGDIIGLYFVLPFFVGLVFFKLIPIGYTFFLSLTNWDGFARRKTVIGFANYVRLFRDVNFYKSLWNTFLIWFMNVWFRMALALLCGVFFAQTKLRGRQIFKAVFYFPNLINTSSVVTLAYLLLDWQTGFVNKFLMRIHLISEPIYWLGVPVYTQSVVAFLIWWMWFGHSAILFTTGILNIPGEIIESAWVDGANAWQRFWKITMPMLRPTFTYVFITSLIGGLQNFDIPRVLDRHGLGSPDKSILTSVLQLYNLAFKTMQYGYASAYAFGLFIVIGLITAFTYRLINHKPNF